MGRHSFTTTAQAIGADASRAQCAGVGCDSLPSPPVSGVAWQGASDSEPGIEEHDELVIPRYDYGRNHANIVATSVPALCRRQRLGSNAGDGLL